MRTSITIAWAVTALIGLVIVFFGIVAIVDPEGTQLADDSDPFGPPPHRLVSAAMTLAGLGLMTWPVFLRRRDKR